MPKKKDVLVSIPVSPEVWKTYEPFAKATGLSVEKLMEAVLISRIMEIAGIADEFIKKGAKKV